ncbi:MAG: flagellar export chaperone FliS [Acidimicrobiia bacterium]|nr:flagellar export chaperone FliS [Acidimicrobiia bacterium]
MTGNPYQNANTAYQNQAVGTANPAQLVLMLYDRALAAIARAERLMVAPEADAIEVIHAELTRAQEIVTELSLSLDYERGGVIAGNLGAIYDFCLARLAEANIKKSPTLLPAVSQSLAELRTAFSEAAAKVAAGAA